jgi:hypothetical protein
VLLSRRGKDWEWYCEIRRLRVETSRSSRHATRFKLTRSLVGCGTQIRSSRCSRSCCCSESEQILTSNRLTISLRAPEDCYQCGSLQLALTAYFRNMEVPSLTDHIEYWTETIKSLASRNGMLTRFKLLACSQAAAAARPAPLGVVHAPSCRFVLQTCHSGVNAAAGSLECVTRFKLLACPPHFACRAGPHSDLPASSSRSHHIVTATRSE